MLTTIADSARQRLTEWLCRHGDYLQRFAQPIPLSIVAQETELDADTVRSTIAAADPPIYHIWSHTYAGRTRPTKPYCLRLGGQDSICLDWEHSIVAAAEAEFRRHGYATCREVGTDHHIRCLIDEPDVGLLTAGINLRDLWAYRRDTNRIDFWIVEAKGKEARGFDRYCFAEALSQLFEIPAKPLTALLGTRRKASHGLCFRIANQLLNAWKMKGWAATITLAVLVPLWKPDVVWDGRTAKRRPQAYYHRSYIELVEFIERGISRRSSPKTGEAAFGEILDGLESSYSIRSLARSANTNVRFRVLATLGDAELELFSLQQFPANCSTFADQVAQRSALV